MKTILEIIEMIPSVYKLSGGEVRRHGVYTARPQCNTWIDISILDEVRAELRKNGHKNRIIFRGPRPHGYGKARWIQPSMTRKEDAVYFIIN